MSITRIKCGLCKGYHAGVEMVRACHMATVPVKIHYYQSGPAASKSQLRFIRDLGGSMARAVQMTRLDASVYITLLKKEGRAVNNRQLKVPLGYLKDIRDGYYAARRDDNEELKFLRISRPKRGIYTGCIKVQSQHGPNLTPVLYVRPNDEVVVQDWRYEEALLLVAVDQRGCAITYAEEIGNCMRCNCELTDERSRWYGIGPECEKHWPDMIALVADRKGYYVEIKC